MVINQNSPALSRWAMSLSLVLLAAIAPATLYAQSPSPCAPDANGDFKPTASVTCQIPENGEFSYRDVLIPADVAVSFARNPRNTPVTIKASGNVTIRGGFFVRGETGNARFGGKGGPGGFDGGRGGSYLDSRSGTAGDGPGGGAGGTAAATGNNFAGGGSFARSGAAGNPPNGAAGPRYGTSTLLPLIGGSGGGGGGAADQGVAGGGGGGGGAILIYCTGTIRFEFLGGHVYGIYAHGGNGGCNSGSAAGGSGGSGGAIRLVADTIIGDPSLNVGGGGLACGNGYNGGDGYIRAEARNLAQFNPTGSPTISTSLTLNPAMLANTPQLKIASVGGQNAPQNPVASFTQQPDIVVPTSVANPVNVVIQATNIPTSTSIQVTLTKDSGERDTKTCTLSGSTATSSCNLSITLPTSGVSVITAATTLDVLVAFGRPMFIDGERVDKVEIAAAFGGGSDITYITESGRRLKWPQ
ncbi:MAG: hypothetical protein ACREEM_48050 [Blastocatellia bacterium]